MSVESFAIALHHSRAKGTAKLVLVGIANHDGDGGSWPSIATLAKYANVNRRNVQRALDELVKLREIEVLVQRGGNGNIEDYQRPNLYKFILACPPDCDRTKNHRTTRDLSVLPSYPQGVAQAPPGGAGAAPGVAQAPPKPSTNHLSTDIDINLLSNRARASAPTCPTTGQAHRINRKLGYCADCLEPIATISSPNRKEGDK